MATSPDVDAGLETVDMLLNMGPQHPSTHGVFRLVLQVDGERIIDAEPVIGYLHRGSEKLCERENYRQIITLFDRLDYLSNFNNELVFCMATEKLMGIEAPERAQLIRTIVLRAQPHLEPHDVLRRVRHRYGGLRDGVHVWLPGARADPADVRVDQRRSHDAQLYQGRRRRDGPA